MTNDIKVPIKDILEVCCKLYNSHFDEVEFIFLRKYFIALLNLNVITPNSLPETVEEFVKQIRGVSVVTEIPHNDKEYDIDLWKLKNYVIIQDRIYVNESIMTESEKYEHTMYKAFSQVLLKIPSAETMFTVVLSTILGESVYCMDYYSKKSPAPIQHTEVINGKTFQTQAGYTDFNLPISLFKQFLYAYEVDEFRLISGIKRDGMATIYSMLLKDKDCRIFWKRISDEFDRYCNRMLHGSSYDGEAEEIESLQIDMSKKFKEKSKWLTKFCFLATSKELTKEIFDAIG